MSHWISVWIWPVCLCESVQPAERGARWRGEVSSATWIELWIPVCFAAATADTETHVHISVQPLLLVAALISVPIMLGVKPYVLKKRHEARHSHGVCTPPSSPLTPPLPSLLQAHARYMVATICAPLQTITTLPVYSYLQLCPAQMRSFRAVTTWVIEA